MHPDNKALAWIEVYSMAVSGAALAPARDPRDVHESACYFADEAVQALEVRWRAWREADESSSE